MIDILFGERLKVLLETGGLKYNRPVSQSELSKELGITRQAISSYLNKSTLPTIDKLKAIAEYFDVSYDYLMGSSNSQKIENSKIVNLLSLKEETVEMLKSVDKTLLRTVIEPMIVLLADVFSRTKRCQNCGKYFIPLRSDVIYCGDISPQDSSRTCRGYITYITQLDKTRYDESRSIHKQIYNSMLNKFKRSGNPILQARLNSFMEDAQKWKDKIKSGEATSEEYVLWLKKIKAEGYNE